MLDTISHAQVRRGFACLSLTSCSPPPFFSFFSFWLLFPSHLWQFTPFNLPFSVNISFLWTLDAFPFYYLHFSRTIYWLFILCLPAIFLSLPVLLSQYLYAAPLCNTSLIHTLLHPPSPPFRSHTINAEKRAQTEVTCTEHIKEVWLNKSPNVC